MQIISRRPLSTEIRVALNKLIEQLLAEGEKRLPSELELAKTLGVSRAALREVLKEMRNEGVIITTHGKPTYINTEFRKMKVTLTPAIEFANAIEKLGYKSSSKLISVSERDTTKEEMNKLRLDKVETILVVKKVFYANGVPVIFCTDMFLKSKLINKEYKKSDLNQSTFEFLIDNANLIIVHDIADISAINLGSIEGYKESNIEDKPAMLLSSIYFTARNKPAMLVEAVFDTDYITLSILRRQDVYKNE